MLLGTVRSSGGASLCHHPARSVTLLGWGNWRDWVCEDKSMEPGRHEVAGRGQGPKSPLEGWPWCLCSASVVLLVSAPQGTCRTWSQKPHTHGTGWSPNQLLWVLEVFFLMKMSNQKKSFPHLAPEMWRIPLLSLCTGLVSAYTPSSPTGLAGPQPTFKPIHISGEGSPSAFAAENQDHFLACLEINASCRFLPLSTASERFLTQSQPVHQWLPGVSSVTNLAAGALPVSVQASVIAGHAAGKCQGPLLAPARDYSSLPTWQSSGGFAVFLNPICPVEKFQGILLGRPHQRSSVTGNCSDPFAGDRAEGCTWCPWVSGGR